MSIHNNTLQAIPVTDAMLSLVSTPKVGPKTLLKEALELMDKKRLGMVCVVESEGELCGVITDGDLRRMLCSSQKPLPALMCDDVVVHAVRNPVTVSTKTSLIEATRIMGEKQVWDLPVVQNGKLQGLLHLHSAIKFFLNEQNDLRF